MISFHRDTDHLGIASKYRDGWEPANLDDPHRIATGILRFPWSGIQWWHGRRNQRSFGRAAWCVLDFDTPEFTLAQAINNVFADCIRIIGTTKSHQRDKNGVVCDRFRVALKFDAVVTDLETYRSSMAFHIARWGADAACVDGARFFWPCTAIVSVADDGETAEVVEPAPRAAPRDYSVYREAKLLPYWIEGLLKFGCPTHTRNSTCFKLGIYMTKCGFSDDEIIELIVASPIPRCGKDALDFQEIARTVRNGARHGREELAREQEKKVNN